MGTLSRMTEAVVLWIQDYLPNDKRDSVNTSIKLSEEASELTHAIYSGDGDVGEEIADCIILLLDIAFLNNVDIEEEFWKKMRTNEMRTWNKSKGCLKHEK